MSVVRWIVSCFVTLHFYDYVRTQSIIFVVGSLRNRRIRKNVNDLIPYFVVLSNCVHQHELKKLFDSVKYLAWINRYVRVRCTYELGLYLQSYKFTNSRDFRFSSLEKNEHFYIYRMNVYLLFPRCDSAFAEYWVITYNVCEYIENTCHTR